jgi:hypothetical protein
MNNEGMTTLTRSVRLAWPERSRRQPDRNRRTHTLWCSYSRPHPRSSFVSFVRFVFIVFIVAAPQGWRGR